MADRNTYPQGYINLILETNGKVTLKANWRTKEEEKGREAGYASCASFRSAGTCGKAMVDEMLAQMHAWLLEQARQGSRPSPAGSEGEPA